MIGRNNLSLNLECLSSFKVNAKLRMAGLQITFVIDLYWLLPHNVATHTKMICARTRLCALCSCSKQFPISNFLTREFMIIICLLDPNFYCSSVDSTDVLQYF